VTKHYYYIVAPDGPVALAIGEGAGTPVIYYLCKDHLGSITGIMNSSGTILEEYNYDPWGRRRNPTNWTYTGVSTPAYTNRGFTGHEHLDMFSLIHMNGRIYDPEISRFLSPDPVIQDPYSIFSYNRYSYCLNNPLKYSDPSGFIVQNEDPPEMQVLNPGWFKYAEPTNLNYYNPFDFLESGGGGGSGGSTYEKPGEGDNGIGLAGVYYDHVSGTYRSTAPGNPELSRAGVTEYFHYLMQAANGGDKVYYDLGLHSYYKRYLKYLAVEGIAFGGSLQVKGAANVYMKNGKYYAAVSASAFTPAGNIGDVTYSGSVDVMTGNKVVYSYSLTPYSGPSISQSGWTNVGQNVFALPGYSTGDVYLRFNVGYSYTEGAGHVSPFPAQGHYRMRIGFTIDAWSY